MVRHLRAAFRQTRLTWKSSWSEWRRFWSTYREYNRLSPNGERIPLVSLYPCLREHAAVTDIEPVYFYQDWWAFQKIAERQPESHVDVGSHHKFVALLSTIVPVTMVDIRPLSLPLETLDFREGSILEMPFEDGSIRSISSMCVIEHIGLGRYGDPLQWDGTERALEELKRITAPGGDLYLSVPLDDDNRIYFNAHRAFTERYLTELFAPFEIVEKKYIYGGRIGDEQGEGFGTGCYHLRRPLE